MEYQQYVEYCQHELSLLKQNLSEAYSVSLSKPLGSSCTTEHAESLRDASKDQFRTFFGKEVLNHHYYVAGFLSSLY